MAPRGNELDEKTRETIVNLFKSGHSYTEISGNVNISRNTVAKVVQRYKKAGTVTNGRRPGRPNKFSDRTKRRMKQLIEGSRRRSAASIAEEISHSLNVTVSAQTVRNILHEDGFKGCIPRRKPLLKTSHKKKRCEFANNHKDKDMQFWDKILWSDETKINLFGSDGVKRVWRRKGEAYKDKCVVPTVKHGGGSLMIWGCMSAKGVGRLAFIEGKMDSKLYCQILEENMLPSLTSVGRRGVFQQDNDPKHTSRPTKAFLESKRVNTLPWPSMSPDLNPIEHLWEHLKRKIEGKNPRNINELKEVIKCEWNAIPADTCRKLVESMPRRLSAVIDNNGGHTKY